MWCVYILECRNGAFYTGATNDLTRRIKEHKDRVGGRFTRAFGVKRMVYQENCAGKSAAFKREASIKRMTRSSKEELVKRSWDEKYK